MLYTHTITGMSCQHCENNVKIAIQQLKLSNVTVSYKKGIISYEASENAFNDIKNSLQATEYGVQPMKKPYITYLAYLVIIAIFLILSKWIYNQFGLMKFNSSTAYVSVFLFGLVTSLHCIGMCGGIALSQTNFSTPKKNVINTLQYNIGRILTYGLMGGFLGLIGSQITISDTFRSTMFFFIGSVMLLIGFNNLGLIKFRIKKLNLIKAKPLKGTTPLIVGIMNGFMPCAPLQTMQLLALTASSFLNGFLVMVVFGLGTMPLLFAFSNIGLFIKKSHHKHIARVSAIIVIFMSIMIFQQGFNTLGVTMVQEEAGLPFAKIEDGYQIVHIEVDPYYTTEAVQVKKDVPVKLLIHVTSVSGCTANIMVPKYDVNTDLMKGQTHELIFTPTQAENLKITCWMSMVNTYLQVVD